MLCVVEVEETQRKETDECMKGVLVSFRRRDGYGHDRYNGTAGKKHSSNRAVKMAFIWLLNNQIYMNNC